LDQFKRNKFRKLDLFASSVLDEESFLLNYTSQQKLVSTAGLSLTDRLLLSTEPDHHESVDGNRSIFRNIIFEKK
jgi:hypothetical protein